MAPTRPRRSAGSSGQKATNHLRSRSTPPATSASSPCAAGTIGVPSERTYDGSGRRPASICSIAAGVAVDEVLADVGVVLGGHRVVAVDGDEAVPDSRDQRAAQRVISHTVKAAMNTHTAAPT